MPLAVKKPLSGAPRLGGYRGRHSQVAFCPTPGRRTLCGLFRSLSPRQIATVIPLANKIGSPSSSRNPNPEFQCTPFALPIRAQVPASWNKCQPLSIDGQVPAAEVIDDSYDSIVRIREDSPLLTPLECA